MAEYSYLIVEEEKPGCLIVQTLGPVSFEVKLTDGQIVQCHQDQIRQRTDESVIPG